MTNKLLLAAIALGLWANALSTWVRPAHADAEDQLVTIEGDMSSMDRTITSLRADVSAIASGSCSNSKIC